jgi:hypothetical protein
VISRGRRDSGTTPGHLLGFDQGRRALSRGHQALLRHHTGKDESHYARAKYLIGRKDKRIGHRLPGGQLRKATDQEIAPAQVHATLALVDVVRELFSELVAGRHPESDSQV